MNLPILARVAATLNYDRATGVLRMLDYRAIPAQTAFVECRDVEAVVDVIQAVEFADAALACTAGYGLALAAHTWQDRPSESRRSAVILAAERLLQARPSDPLLHTLIQQARAAADHAVLHGASAGAAIADVVDAAVRRADKVAERCGRRAAELLDDGDRVLAHGYAGAAWAWMLHAASRQQGKRLDLTFAPISSSRSTQIAAQLARELGASVQILPDAAALDGAEFSLGITGALQVAADGSITDAAGTHQYAVLAQQQRIPYYALGYDRLDGELTLPSAQAATIPADLISAIVTDRGIYRPAMIARYLDEGDAPLDVIPLGGE